jgi:endonuclease/exonuclease/phosphatase family metal-dependent hydrolase
MRPLALAALLATLVSSPAARAESPIRLRLVTWNVWGVPLITTDLDERLAALPDALAALEPDIVCLQELWTARHIESVSARLSQRGLRHFRRFESPDGVTGLIVASKLPLGAAVFRPFSFGRMPHSFWHLDWLVEKGVADVTVETPLGALRLQNTHLQAQYRTDGYGAERLAQAVEVVLGSRDRANEPLVVAGDFNGPGDDLPRRTLRDLGGFADAAPHSSEDSVYVRGAGEVSLRIVSARTALAGSVSLENGEKQPLSDHAALVVELELTRCVGCAPPRRVVSGTRAAAKSSLERAADITPFRVVLALATAAAQLAFGVAFVRRSGKLTSGSRRRVALRALVLALLAAGFVWSAYLGAFYYPSRANLLRRIAGELAALPER